MPWASDMGEDRGSEQICTDLLPFFTPDGSLRDIYVLNTRTEDWNSLIAGLAGSDLPVKISKPFERLEDFDAAPVFEHVTNSSPVQMQVFLSETIKAHSHFFTSNEVEFDLDPRQIKSKADVAGILKFMRTIGEILSSEVILTEESCQHDPILSFKPATGEFVTT